ncbi:cytochrome c oxidase (aa3-type) subunit IV [Aeropyrum pernix K1]|uniref:Heme-copper oxidase subunit 4 n=2 Tax=Aeropyrum pernix TaxID=56636 RepID=AOX4_AERPE|nr:cytochrome C oxidase subunit IV family protein [Aeropyrum pernix]Q9YDX4.2 RecName: Full=Heme-copper oxidase subunit 4; AltName: Full=Heme-copper oxidase subunit IV [Aeropyrum pernix K1]BAA79773.2 cytochrome c oxidase (aa3-type) subunit IV [Aeropyrum pernix K1]BAA86073.1 heme-copper oxidase subunit IV [Aeropyrum pernix]GBF09264.1 heme-copper oxidase subunit 4 [Aeropyrum pernix]
MASGGGFEDLAREAAKYFGVWIVLVASAVAEVYLVLEGIARNPFVFVLAVALFQSSLIALFFQHLRDEPIIIRGITVSGAVLIAILIISAVTSVLTCTPYFPG